MTINQELLKYEVVEHNPTAKPIDKAIIWLHGLGASGHDFVPVVPELGLDSNLGIRFIFPHARAIPVTINGGYVMPAWYDILEMSFERKIDVEQIEQSSHHIDRLIDEQIALGIDSANIIIAGFSQGGAVAYHHALGSSRPLAGLLALSTYFATKDALKIQASRSLPIKIDHGLYDGVVPFSLGQMAYQTIQNLGYTPSFNSYAMAHQVCIEQLHNIGTWINACYGYGKVK